MNVIIHDSNRFGALSEQRLSKFEEEIGYSLPTDYRDFLLTHNGGKPELNDFFINDEQGSSILQWLYGIHDGPSWASLLSALEVFRTRLPSGLLAIGQDLGGNQVCIALGTGKRGAIYFWDHEEEAPDDQEPTWENIYLVADSFSDFLKNLTAVPESEIEGSALEQACQKGDLDTIRQYLNAGGDANQQNEYGFSLATAAAAHGQLEILRTLIEHGADVTGVLSIAAQNGQAQAIEYLLAQGADIEEVTDNRADTPLMKAAVGGHREAVETLLKHGADVNAKNKYGQTAVVKASWSEHSDVMNLLKKYGAQ